MSGIDIDEIQTVIDAIGSSGDATGKWAKAIDAIMRTVFAVRDRFRKPDTDANDAPSEGDEPGASTAEAGNAAAEGDDAQRYAELELRVARCEEAIGMLAESACGLTQLAKSLVEANGQITKALGMQCDLSKDIVEQTGLLARQTESLSKGLAMTGEAIKTISAE